MAISVGDWVKVTRKSGIVGGIAETVGQVERIEKDPNWTTYTLSPHSQVFTTDAYTFQKVSQPKNK